MMNNYIFDGVEFTGFDKPFGSDCWFIDYSTTDENGDITFETISSEYCDIDDIKELLNKIVSYPQVMGLLSGDIMLKIND